MTAEKLWSTIQVSRDKAYHFWRSALCEAVFELDLDLPDTSNILGCIRQRPLGSLPVSLIELNCAQTVWRTQAAIGRSTRQQMEFVTLLQGQAALEYCGTEVLLTAGDSILIDGRRPYGFSTSNLRSLTFHMPAGWLDQWILRPERFTGIPLRRNTPWGCAISAVIGETPWDTIGDSGDRALKAEHLAMLLSFAFSAHPAVPVPAVSHRTFVRAIDMLRQHAHDTTLNAGELAHLLKISPRYLHKLFASNRTTYNRELQKERLSLAARMLVDRRFDDLPIGEIAWRSGFADASHFSRRFKEWKGVPPARFRLDRSSPR